MEEIATGSAHSDSSSITLTIYLDSSGTGKGIRWYIRNNSFGGSFSEVSWESLTSGTTFSHYYGGLTSSTSYTVKADIYYTNGSTGNTSAWTFIEGQEATLSTDPAPTPPGATSGISASAVAQRSPKLMNVYWNSVSGATGYRLYKSSDGGSNYYPVVGSDGQVGNITSYQVTVDYEWQYYSFQVTATNAYGNGPNVYSSQYKSYDSYAPYVNQFFVTQQTTTGITVYVQGNDTPPDAGSMSGVSSASFYKNGSYMTNLRANSSGEVYYTFTGLTIGVSYTFSVDVRDVQGNISGQSSINITFNGGRPANFSWTNSKNSGSNFNVLASEWNDFTQRINNFRSYKSLTSYSFTTAIYGNDVNASVFNEAINAISAMSPPISTPSLKSSKQDIYASYFNDIVTSLNSIA